MKFSQKKGRTRLLTGIALGAMMLCATPVLVSQVSAQAQDAAKAQSAAVKKGQPQLGEWGFDTTGMDLTVKPGDNFFLYANGNWLKRTEIPADQSVYGAFNALRDESDKRVRLIVEDLAKKQWPAGTDEQKIADYYNSYLDVAAIEKAGTTALDADLARIDAAKTYEDVARLMGEPGLNIRGPVGYGVGLDQKNPDRYLVAVSQSGLGLPDRDLYLKDDARSKKLRTAYIGYIGQMLSLDGDADAAAKAGLIFDFETQIANLQWDRVKNRNRDLTYNLKSFAELEALAPGFPWKAAMQATGLKDVKEVNVVQPDAVAALAKLFSETPIDTLKAYMKFHQISGSAAVLPARFDQANFAFYGKLLSGQPEQRQRWQRGVASLAGALGESVGKIYVAKYFPPEYKAQMQELVKNLRTAYGNRIQKLTWMSAETKKEALGKLKAFRPKIGFPDEWRDYSALTIKAGDAYGNAKAADIFDVQRDIKRINDKTDRGEWGMTPQTVNAYYNPVFNEIVFPAAILQPPFFDPFADPAVNYGGIGGVIGHEMGHGFDDQGAKSDAKGVLRSWWKTEDEAAFKKLTASLSDRYSSYQPLPGLNLNGKLSLGEDIGDNGGLSVAYEAYKLSLKGKPAPVINGFTGDQRFFLGWAQVWRTKYREERLRLQIQTDPHSPGEFRVRGVVPNVDAWYKAFNVQPTDKAYLTPEQRVKIW